MVEYLNEHTCNMQYPLISEYIEAILSSEDNFDKLSNLRPILDEYGNPIMSSGNFAVVFKMTDGEKNYAIKCFLKEQKGRKEAYNQICDHISSIHTKHFVSTSYYEKELFVDTTQTEENEFPVLLMDWVDGLGLSEYISRNYDNSEKMANLYNNLQDMIEWLLPSHLAHGDLKPDNIIVTADSNIVLIDYDGMFVPSMQGQYSREHGTPQFQYQGRTISDFNEYIDDYAGIYLALIIKLISIDRKTLEFFTSMSKETLVAYASKHINNIFISKLLSAYLLVNSMGFIEHEMLYNVFYNERKRNRKLELNLLSNALKGDTQAMIQLGDSYSSGKFTPQNSYKALEFYYTAKSMGNVNASCRICRHFYHFQNDCYNIKNYRKNPIHRAMCDNQIDFSLCREAEEDLYKDSNHANEYFQKAESLEFAPAINWIAIRKDTFSIKKLEQAANLGYADANKDLADYYRKGKHVQQNLKESIKYYRRAAELGNSEAQTIIGEVYSKGMVEYPVSWIDAVYWFEKSAQQGNLKAIRQLFFCYLNGTGVERNYDKAFSLIDYYYDTSDSVILFLLGYCYENAIGTAKYYQAAYNYYLKSVHSVGGYTLAEVRLELLCKQHDIKDETFVEQYEIAEIGECGTGTYSSDGHRFLCYWGTYGEEYSVAEGTEVLCDDSFNDLYSECDGHYLEKLILPESLVRIGNNVFCASITNIECNSCNFVIENGFLLSNDKKTLYRYFGSDEVVNIPTTVIFVKGGAFSEKQIKHIHIPKSVKYIGNNPFAGINYQFYYSWKIEDNMPFKITCESENYKIINNTLYDLKGKIIIAYWGHDKIVQVEKWTKEIGKNAFFQSNIEIIDLTNSQIKIVHETAFYRCFNLHSIQISKGTMLQYRSLLPTYLQDLIQEI